MNRCAPPANKPTPEERDACLPFFVRELEALEAGQGSRLPRERTPGTGTLRALGLLGHPARPKPRFGHGAETSVGPYRLIGCFHPSQQNTFTGKLTPDMLDEVLRRAGSAADGLDRTVAATHAGNT